MCSCYAGKQCGGLRWQIEGRYRHVGESGTRVSTETEQKGLGIKPFEVLGYAISAIASAVLGSFFGFSGTVIGAGVASAISMVGAAVFQRGAEKTRQAAKRAARNKTGSVRVQQPRGQSVQQQARPPAPQAPPPASGRSAHPGSPPASDQPGRATTSHRYPAVDPDRQIANLAAPLSEQPTRYLSPTTAADTASTRPAAGDAAPTDPELDSGQIPWWRRHWKLLIGLFAVVFVIGVGGVSLIELASGGPLSGGSGGTSVGRLVDGSGTGDRPSEPQRTDQHPGGTDTTDTRHDQPDPTGQNPGPTNGQQPNQTAPQTGGSAPNSREQQDQDQSGDQNNEDQGGGQGNNQDQGGDQKQNQQRDRGQGQNPPGNQNQG